MVSHQLRLIRKQNRLSQQQLSDILGISRSTYCSYEIGRRTPDIETLMKLSDFYKLTLDHFVNKIEMEYIQDEEYYDGQPDVRYLSQLSRSERDLLVKLRCLDKNEQELIKKLIEEKLNK
ncbi:MAG: helix-turn-helix transcriptional regulator [Clostridia bacterium]|nr:helix-turn-helix transcriptional regulator [Clostridia bacterium]